MSFIYPECPACDEKSSKGIDLCKMPDFKFRCDSCGHRRRGYFKMEPDPHVQWGERIGLTDWLLS